MVRLPLHSVNAKKPHRLMVKIKEETYATEQGVRNGKIKEETYATEQGVGKATGRARRSLAWLVAWS